MLIVDVQGPDDPESRIRVGVLGSCRARDLLFNCYKSEEAEASRGDSVPCELVSYRFSAFTHNVRQAHQYYRFLKYRTPFPRELQPLIFSNYLDAKERQLAHYTPELIDSIEVFVVEISTFNNFVCNGAIVNSNYTEQKFVKAGGKPMLKWWRAVSNLTDDELAPVIEETLASLPTRGVPDLPEVRSIIRHMRRSTEDGLNFKNSLQALADELAVPMVVAPLFSLPNTVVESRDELRQVVSNLSSDIGYHVYDSTGLIADHGVARSMADDGTSTVHYAHSFHHVLLNDFRSFLHRTVALREVATRAA